MTAALELADAQARLLILAESLECEDIAVVDALGRILRQDVVAARAQPPADLSAMDGYAVMGNGPWSIAGESRAGHPYSAAMQAGQAVRISTGAVMPAGAQSVLLQEDAERSDDTVQAIGDSPIAGQHIRRTGFDFTAGELLIARGQRLTAAGTALALSAGLTHLQVTRRPRAVFIDTGDELTGDGGALQAHRIPASNSAMLAALCHGIPSDIRRLGPVPDDLDALADTLLSATDADLIVTTGGASVGDHDLIRPALARIGATLDFWRVAIKPGKPLLVARRGKQTIIGLPGNPVSAFVTGYLFVLPFLRAMSGDQAPLPSPMMLPLAKPMASGGVRREFVRGMLGADGVCPLDQTDSSALRTLALANVLIERPAHAREVKAGTPVPVYLLENG